MPDQDYGAIARWTGAALFTALAIGIANATVVSPGIDINLSANVSDVSTRMLEAEQSLRARGWLLTAIFFAELLVVLGLFHLTRDASRFGAGFATLAGVVASTLALWGAVNAFNAAEVASGNLPASTDPGGLAAIQAITNYSSFHLALVMSSISNAVFYRLFLTNRRLPAWIAGFGLFASIVVAIAIVARDFVPPLTSSLVTNAFMACNLIALVLTAAYLLIGSREVVAKPSVLT